MKLSPDSIVTIICTGALGLFIALQEDGRPDIENAVAEALAKQPAPPALPPVTNTNEANPTINVGTDHPSAKQFLSAAAFAQSQDVNEKTVRRWIEEGRLDPAPQKDATGVWMIEPDAVVTP